VIHLQKEPPASPFKPVDKNLAKEQDMPSGVFVRDIETENSKKAIKEGKAFIHFFPQGFVEPSVIHLQKDGDEETVYSLVVSPLTGKVTTYHEDVHPF
jgi:general secretion pathway protein H